MSDDSFIEKLAKFEDNLIRRMKKEVVEDLDNKIEELKDQFYTYRDYSITVLKRLDEERIFTVRWVENIEQDLEDQKNRLNKSEKDIVKIKRDLNIK